MELQTPFETAMSLQSGDKAVGFTVRCLGCSLAVRKETYEEAERWSLAHTSSDGWGCEKPDVEIFIAQHEPTPEPAQDEPIAAGTDGGKITAMPPPLDESDLMTAHQLFKRSKALRRESNHNA